MKKVCLLLALTAGLVTGCATRYDITLTNSNTITAFSKPKLVEGFYVFKNAAGEEARVSAMRVAAIGPQSHSESKGRSTKFISK